MNKDLDVDSLCKNFPEGIAKLRARKGDRLGERLAKIMERKSVRLAYNYMCFPFGKAEALKGFSQAWWYSLDMARIVMPFGKVSFSSCNSQTA